MKRFAILFGLLCSILLTPLSRAADRASLEPTVQLFLNACVIPYTHAALVEHEAKTRGFAELRLDVANRYLGGAPGRAWGGTIESKRFVIALRPEVLCTIIAHDGDAAEIKLVLESWLPPAASGIEVKKQTIPAPEGLETTVYQLRGGRVQERWVATVSIDPKSETRALLSWGRL